jgi:hypothetical protein
MRGIPEGSQDEAEEKESRRLHFQERVSNCLYPHPSRNVSRSFQVANLNLNEKLRRTAQKYSEVTNFLIYVHCMYLT